METSEKNLKTLKSTIMSETNFPSPSAQVTSGKSYKNAIIGVLAAGLIAVSGYLIYAKNDSSQVIQQKETQIAKVSDEKSDVQANFDASLARLDAELSRAKTLIASLNDKIASMEMDIAQLKQDNQMLNNDNVVLKKEKEVLNTNLAATTAVKQELEKKVDVASTLNASNIIITPINVKKSGKEKISTTAKRVDKIIVNFDVDNRIVQPGTTDVYVLVLGPDGKPVTTGSETFTTRDDETLGYTAKVSVDLETAKKKNVQFAFAPGTSFTQGNYTIQIYQNGFLIGQGTKELKKGGLFS